MTRRISLIHAPTPIVRRPAIDALVGAEVWVKRDDAIGGAEAGNKLRKLEFLLAHALHEGARTVITCGGLQSNHARTTALACASLGLSCVLFLRVPDPKRQRGIDPSGNVLLDLMAGAEIRLISPDEYKQRNGIMESARQELDRAYVIPEGGSNGLGSLGYVEAMRETREQMDLGLTGSDKPFDVVAHACGSGGTAAGVALGSAHFRVAREAWAFAVCDDRTHFERVIHDIASQTRGYMPELPHTQVRVDDHALGPAYAVMSDAQKRFLVEVARKTGFVLDPVYSGKALFGLKLAVERGDIAKDSRVLFIHTGGLPGLLAQGEELAEALG